jgi:hypothetical protein
MLYLFSILQILRIPQSTLNRLCWSSVTLTGALLHHLISQAARMLLSFPLSWDNKLSILSASNNCHKEFVIRLFNHFSGRAS